MELIEPVTKGTWYLMWAVAALVAFFVLLPILGMLLVGVVSLMLLGGLFFLAAPFLAKLPWFRDRIHVERHGGGRFIRFGNGASTSHGGDPFQTRSRPVDPDVIDVEGREVPTDSDADGDEEEELLLPPSDQ